MDPVRLRRRDRPGSEDPVATLNDLGITHVEFRSAWDINVLDLTDEQVDEVAALLAAHGLSVSSIGSPLGKINIEDDFDAHLVRADRALAVAERLDAPFIRIFSFFLRPDQAPEDHRDEVLRRMSGPHRARRAHRRRPAAREREGHLRRRPGARPRHRRVGRLPGPAAGLGPRQLRAGGGHPVHRGRTRRCARTPPTSRSRTRCSPPVRWCPPGEGDGQVRETVRALAADGFDGFFSMEPHLGLLQPSRARSPGPPTSPAPPARSPPSSTAKESHYHEQPQGPVRRGRRRRHRRRCTPGRWPSWPTSRSWSPSSTPTRPRPRSAGRRGTASTVHHRPRRGAAARRHRRRHHLHAQRPARRRRRGGAGRRQARRRREARRHHPGRGGPDHRRREALREDGRGDLPAPVRQVHREGPRRRSATVASAPSPRPSPRTPGGAGRRYYDSGDWRGTWALDGGGAS